MSRFGIWLGLLVVVILVAFWVSRRSRTRVGDSHVLPDAHDENREDKTTFLNRQLAKWLADHGHSDVVTDAAGVGLKSNQTRLRAEVIGLNLQPNGTVVANVGFLIRLPSGQEIAEQVGGLGPDDELAVTDATFNFLVTTFHVVHKAFMDPSDPHLIAKTISNQGQTREVILGDTYLREGVATSDIHLEDFREATLKMLEATPIPEGMHWVKILYLQQENVAKTVVVTLDYENHQAMTEAVGRFPWPRRKEFYLVKQFLVVR